MSIGAKEHILPIPRPVPIDHPAGPREIGCSACAAARRWGALLAGRIGGSASAGRNVHFAVCSRVTVSIATGPEDDRYGSSHRHSSLHPVISP
jgi:hypothetical protein